MKFGVQTLHQNSGGDLTDHDAIVRELTLAEEVESLGFDSLWTVEHHFTSYSMCPDPLQFLAFAAARTRHIELGTMALIVPWHNPARLAGQITFLDNLSNGRLIVGLGRGLGRDEFEGLGVSMDESRARFREGVDILVKGLKGDSLQYSGTVFEQAHRTIRPAAAASFHNRIYAAAVSPPSIQTVAELGVGLLVGPQKAWSALAADVQHYASTFAALHSRPAPARVVSCQVVCHRSAEIARSLRDRYMDNYFETLMAHYEMTGEHFRGTSGYEHYSQVAEKLGTRSSASAARGLSAVQISGDPHECIDQVAELTELTGADHFVGNFSFGGMDLATAQSSMRLFAEQVIPALQPAHRRKAIS
ncbi:LLM class flavin-dependent oxidoreductase [Mycobacterium sp. NPDC050853]|uniref:LLM class flavin-dependent oxidoreductase n=1 Tax=Mycobacterium sp. NPDC050853 TaxID=3155160 RepID=UPI0033E5F1F3